MRILHVIGSLEQGGAEAVLFRLATAPSDVQHQVVSVAGPAFYSQMLQERGIEVVHLDADSLWTRATVFLRLRREISRRQPDVVQSWMYRANVAAGLAARAAGVPVVWGVHCASYAEVPLRGKVWVYLSAAVARLLPDRIINCSIFSAELHRKIGFADEMTTVVPNGYDVSVFAPDDSARHRIRAEFSIAPDTFLIGTVARWHPQKDHGNLILALKKLREQAGWKCLLVGPGIDPDNSELVAALAAAGVSDRTILAGARDDVPKIMTGLDLHVLPSAEEAFPNVVAEAMAAGTPCLVTDVGDASMMVGDTGWVVPPRAPEALAHGIAGALREWSGDPERWRQRTEAARRRIEANFSLDRMVDRYREVWKSVAARPLSR